MPDDPKDRLDAWQERWLTKAALPSPATPSPATPSPVLPIPADPLDRFAQRWLGLTPGDQNNSAKGRAGGRTYEKVGRKPIDLMGQKFGMNTVTGGPERVSTSGTVGNPVHEYLWECTCECGALTWVSTANLRHGRVLACKKRICRAEIRKRDKR